MLLAQTAFEQPWNTYIGARVAQWVRSFDLTAHISLSPILCGFAPSFVNYKKGCTRLAAASDKVYQLLAQGRWFSPGTPVSSTTKNWSPWYSWNTAESGVKTQLINQWNTYYIIYISFQGVRNVAALSLVIGYPTTASVPHSLANGFKKLLAVAIGTDYTFKEAEKVSLNVFN